MSWPPGEYCSKGTDRSRYSCGRQAGCGQRGSGSAREPSRSRAGQAHTHVSGSHSEHAVQVLHQLLEGGPLRGRGVPALTHDHVPGGHASRPRPASPAPGPRDWPPPPQRRAHSQVMRAVGRLVHAVAFLQQLEELLHGDARVRRAPQREDLPEQDPEGPPVGGGGQSRVSPGTDPTGAQGSRQGAAPKTFPAPAPRGLCSTPRPRPCQVWGHIHITLVGVDAVKQGLGCHPLHGQAALGVRRERVGCQAPSWPEGPHLLGLSSRLSSSCSSRGCAHHGPGRSRRFSSRCPRSPARCGPPGPYECTGGRGHEFEPVPRPLQPPRLSPQPPAPLTFCEARYSMPRATW